MNAASITFTLQQCGSAVGGSRKKKGGAPDDSRCKNVTYIVKDNSLILEVDNPSESSATITPKTEFIPRRPGQNFLMTLPLEVLNIILENVDSKSTVTCSQTCQYLKDILNEKVIECKKQFLINVLNTLSFKSTGVNIFDKNARPQPQIYFYNLENEINKEDVDAIIEALRKLRSTINPGISDQEFEAFVATWKKFKELPTNNWNLYYNDSFKFDESVNFNNVLSDVEENLKAKLINMMNNPSEYIMNKLNEFGELKKKERTAGGAKKKYTKSDQRIVLGGIKRVVYLGTRGGKYVKIKGDYVAVAKFKN